MGVLRLLYYLAIVLAGLYFAEANRGLVRVSFDPFPGGEGSNLGFEAPLFLVVFAAVALGVVLGAFTSWMRHASVRRSAKQARAEAAKAQGELARLRSETPSSPSSASSKK